MDGKKIYQKTWFIVVMIIFFFPVGLFLMWKYTNWNKNIKIAVCVLIVLIGVIGIPTDDTDTTPPENNDNDLITSQLNEPEKEKEEPKLTPQEQFAKDNGLTPELTSAIIDASNLIGVPLEDIHSFSKVDNWASGERYQYSYDGIALTVYMNADGTVNSINSGDIKFIDSGVIKCQVQDRIVSTMQSTYLMISAEDTILNYLKSPSTAEFPGHIMESDKWVVSRDGDTFFVQSYVDAQNSFGAMIRNNFIVKYSWNGDTATSPAVLDVAIE